VNARISDAQEVFRSLCPYIHSDINENTTTVHFSPKNIKCAERVAPDFSQSRIARRTSRLPLQQLLHHLRPLFWRRHRLEACEPRLRRQPSDARPVEQLKRRPELRVCLLLILPAAAAAGDNAGRETDQSGKANRLEPDGRAACGAEAALQPTA